LKRRAGLIALTVAAGLAGCASAGGPARLTGLGATIAGWNAHHGSAYSAVLTDPGGHVQSYIQDFDARTLASALAQVKADLPADANASEPQLVVGIEGTTCEIVDFTSATLRRVLGGAHGGMVTAAFSSANVLVMDTDRIVRVVVVSGNENLPRQC
jgi:hypothetical protein